MNKLLTAVHLDDPASLKRFIVLSLSALAVLATPLLSKYGIPTPSDTQLEVFAGIVITYLTQSSAKSIVEAHAEGKAEAAKITTAGQAQAVILEAAKPVVDVTVNTGDVK